jgi:glycosyltransferase involved in cell wall biosynthesis
MEEQHAVGDENVTILLPVYIDDNPDWFFQAFRSITYGQTLKPNEVFVYCDGPVNSNIDDFLSREGEFNNEWCLTVVRNKENLGLGKVLKKSLGQIRSPFIVRMDADDIAHPQRIEKSLSKLKQGFDIVGSNMVEFDESGIETRKVVPETNEEIRQGLTYRNTINHPTVAFRKDKVLLAGGYRHMPSFEDYDLWIRCSSLKSVKFYNIQDELVKFRITSSYWFRRRGWLYMKKEISFALIRYAEQNLNLYSLIYIVFRSFVLRNIPKSLFIKIIKQLRDES